MELAPDVGVLLAADGLEEKDGQSALDDGFL